MNQEITLTEKQLIGLERLGELTNIKEPVRKLSWIGRFFDWININILDKTSKFWVYCLEIAGIFFIVIVVSEFRTGLQMIVDANTELELQKAQLFVDAVKSSATPIAAMVATICGALPSIIGILRTLKTKWKNGNHLDNDVTNIS